MCAAQRDGVEQSLRRSTARFKILRADQDRESLVGLGQHGRCAIAGSETNGGRLVVAVVRIERHRQTAAALLPVATFPDVAVGDVAQRGNGHDRVGLPNQ